MPFRKTFFLIIYISISTLIFNNQVFAKNTAIPNSLSANAAILVDIKKNKVLFARNIHKRLEPASTAKVMTAILVLEKLNLEKSIVASRNACNKQPSKANLRPNVSYKVRDLLYAVLMASSNDAAVCLAEAIAGSEDNFVKLMNARARQLGCRNSHFINCNGLPSSGGKQYTTVHDLTIMIKRLTKYKIAMEIMRRQYYSFRGNDGILIKLRNHDKLLWRHPNIAIGKTGFTRKAGHCFVGKDTLKNKEIVFALLRSNNIWPDINYLLRRANCI
ncbi:MAG: serine hydrolase [Candidatus Omnitrophota bacterium]